MGLPLHRTVCGRWTEQQLLSRFPPRKQYAA
jgi:hypothetical protein